MAGNLLLYQTLNQERLSTNKFSVWVYILAWFAIISSFARLMFKFRKSNINSIKWITMPMIPCELSICDMEIIDDEVDYRPLWKRIFCCGFICFFLWIWYAILIYPFVTLIVIFYAIIYDVEDIEFTKLVLLYKNHNIIAFIIEDIPILAVLIEVYKTEKKDLFVLIWVCLSTSYKLITIIRRLYNRKLLFNVDELNEEIAYERAKSNSSGSDRNPDIEHALDLELQILDEGI